MKSSEQGAPLSVRVAVAADAVDIARIQAAGLEESITAGLGGADCASSISDASTYPNISEADLSRVWSGTLSQAPPQGCTVLVALDGREVVAVMMAESGAILNRNGMDPIPEGTDIAVLEVQASHRRSGHASRLTAALVDTLHPTCLRIWVTSGDEARTRFLTSLGFRPAGLRRSLDVMHQPLVQHLWWSLVDE